VIEQGVRTFSARSLKTIVLWQSAAGSAGLVRLRGASQKKPTGNASKAITGKPAIARFSRDAVARLVPMNAERENNDIILLTITIWLGLRALPG